MLLGYTDGMEKSMHNKIIAAMQKVGVIEKNGENKHFKFKYQAWDDVLPVMKSAFMDAGLVFEPSITNATYIKTRTSEGHETLSRALVQMRFIVKDAETGQVLTDASWYGESGTADDKAIQKAATSATKYFLLKYLMIPSNDADPDGDGPIATPAKPHVQKPDPKREMIAALGEAAVKRLAERCAKEKVNLIKAFTETRDNPKVELTESSVDAVIDLMVAERG